MSPRERETSDDSGLDHTQTGLFQGREISRSPSACGWGDDAWMFLFFFFFAWTNLSSSVWSVHDAFVCLPLRKQCQAVGGQEKFQPMSSSSDREDLVDTAEPHSLLFCGHKRQNKRLPQSQELGFKIFFFSFWGSSLYPAAPTLPDVTSGGRHGAAGERWRRPSVGM